MDENKLDLIFKAYDVRGVFNESITPEIAFKIGAAFASNVDSDRIFLIIDFDANANIGYEFTVSLEIL